MCVNESTWTVDPCSYYLYFRGQSGCADVDTISECHDRGFERCCLGDTSTRAWNASDVSVLLCISLLLESL